MSAYALWKKLVKNQVGIKLIYMVKYLYNIHYFKPRNREWEYLEGLDVILYIACQIGNLPIVMDVIKRGCNPRLGNDEPIICASKYGQLKIVKYLCSIGCDPTVDMSEALQSACWHGHLNVMKFLHKVGCDVQVFRNYPILVAIREGYLDIVKWLYKLGCNPIDPTGNFPVAMSRSSVHRNVKDFLLQNGVPIEK